MGVIRERGFGIYAPALAKAVDYALCDLNHKMAALNHNLAADDDDDHLS
jgi:hypothetical protein